MVLPAPARLQPKTFYKGDVIIDHDQAAQRSNCFGLGSAAGVCQPPLLRMTRSFFGFNVCVCFPEFVYVYA